MAIETDRDDPQRASERDVERHDARARVAWTEGYLYAVKAKLARALARKRILEDLKYRRAAHDVARALDRNRKRPRP